ncbi:zinc-dependent alcohol dehydrogenase family protein [Acinetobacter gerneri]|jgi:NADPH:quinone reductase-like Zn-dependent oxidoreductase|uniref:zinc-dependent alcohol dehydrogenase family protein n=1 Tax=Acinetobacter gerneri TaxID=202952 RepID=UPI0023F38E29|nr:NAD(P)-dependent alcohol dehydrogenase [Acinetobacter gerneri]MCH4243451.1 NAD(P)-dependent alcohol dehydrogenase [Acinetobacter gerneri]
MLKTIKQWGVNPDRTNELLQIETTLPALGENQVLVKVNAVSLNYRDLIEINNFDPKKTPKSYALASDMAGEIIEIGANVSQFTVGDKVINSFFSEWINGHFHGKLDHIIETFGSSKLSGVLSEYLILSENHLVKAPTNLNDIESSTLACAAVTAWQALIEIGHLKAGETVVIQGTGGVATFALQIALAHGANCIVLSRDEHKLQKLSHLGAFHAINTTVTPDWHNEVSKITHEYGAEHILELISGENLNKSLSAISFHGKIYIIGVLSSFETQINIQPMLFKRPQLHGIGVGSKQVLQDVVKAIELLNIKPIIDRIYSFDEIPEAFKHLKKGALGKIVIDFNQ